MAEITAGMVKELRERTGAGMMDCKNALTEAGGDMARAAEILQKKGAAKVVKAAGKIAADGMIVAAVSPDFQKGVIVEVNCVTDFVARGDDFKAFATLVAKKALESGAADLATLEALQVDGRSLKERADELTARSGEKHAIRRVERFEVAGRGVVTSYIHHGSRLGVLVEVANEKGNTPEVREFADEVALQIASMNPKYVHRDEAPQDAIARQRDIFVGQMQNEETEAVNELEDWKRRMAEEGGEPSEAVTRRLKELEKKVAGLKGRPEAARAKILDGKVNKWLTEVTLLDQASIKDPNKTVGQLLQEFVSKHGKTEIRRFARFELGEGIEKGVAKDFAAEVAESIAAAQKQS
jgi:elongation factor Ts